MANEKATAKSAKASNTDSITPALNKPLSFMRVLWAVAHGLQSTSKRMESRLGITGPQRLTLQILQNFPKISAGQLAEILHVHPSTLTGVLQRLEERGLVHRESDPGDRRRTMFTVTQKGKRQLLNRAGTVEQAVRKAMARIAAKDISATQETLATLAEELSNT